MKRRDLLKGILFVCPSIAIHTKTVKTIPVPVPTPLLTKKEQCIEMDCTLLNEHSKEISTPQKVKFIIHDDGTLCNSESITFLIFSSDCNVENVALYHNNKLFGECKCIVHARIHSGDSVRFEQNAIRSAV